jgi:hypothetical protein
MMDVKIRPKQAAKRYDKRIRIRILGMVCRSRDEEDPKRVRGIVMQDYIPIFVRGATTRMDLDLWIRQVEKNDREGLTNTSNR